MDSSAVRILGEKNIKKYGSNVITITNPTLFPDPSIVEEYLEPMVLGTIITPGKIKIGTCLVE
jgi:translation factor GUF1, mitochondrial